MNDEEIKLLLKGVKIYGTSNWAQISKNLLPKWERRQLRKIYVRKLKPKLVINQNIENSENVNIDDIDNNTNNNNMEYPNLNDEEEKEILNDPVKLRNLRNRIANIHCLEKRFNKYTEIDFFNPSLDIDDVIDSQYNKNDDRLNDDSNNNNNNMDDIGNIFVECLSNDQRVSLLQMYDDQISL